MPPKPAPSAPSNIPRDQDEDITWAWLHGRYAAEIFEEEEAGITWRPAGGDVASKNSLSTSPEALAPWTMSTGENLFDILSRQFSEYDDKDKARAGTAVGASSCKDAGGGGVKKGKGLVDKEKDERIRQGG